MIDGDVEYAIRALNRDQNVWLNINTEHIPRRVLPENLNPRHSVEIKKFTKVYQPKKTLSVRWFNFKKKFGRKQHSRVLQGL